MHRLETLSRHVVAQPAMMQLPQAPADDACAHLLISPAVRDALREGGAIVALESTIITHGMPFPQNLETARAVEAEVRAHGATPATIAILDGRCHIGLDEAQLERLARLGRERVRKVSRRDLAAVVAAGAHGATTVSATMVLAHAAGIRVFVTGGIGGVHRDGHNSLDISADLSELARTPVAVVCAGIKSILDIGRTLEVLETAGVTVATLSAQADAEFPAFFTARSGHPSPLVWASEDEAAAAIEAALALRLHSAQLIAVPIPAEQAAEGEAVEAAIRAALLEADARAIRGADTTPFLLGRVAELTAGASLRANIALVRNNARAGARIAVALADRLRAPAVEFAAISLGGAVGGGLHGRGGAADARGGAGAGAGAGGGPGGPGGPGGAGVLVVGGAVADLTASPSGRGALVLGTSNPGALALSAGGVGRNIAEGLARLGCRASLLSCVGADALGELVLGACAAARLDTSAVQRAPAPHRTATYTALHHGPDGDLLGAVADMTVFEIMDARWVRARAPPLLDGAALAVADANVPMEGLLALGALCAARALPLLLEPVSVAKAAAAARAGVLSLCAFASPNEDELLAMARALGAREPAALAPEGSAQRASQVDALCAHVLLSAGAGAAGGAAAAPARAPAHAPAALTLLVTCGAAGALVAARADAAAGGRAVRVVRYPALPCAVRSTRGAGDSFVAGFAAQWLRGAGEAACVRAALAAAAASLEVEEAISPALSPALLAPGDGLAARHV
jgi:pseudouridine-5'-phosphate glycosidase/pseudouridine kinase